MSTDESTHSIQQANSNIITVWLDAHVHQTDDCLKTQEYLRRFFSDLLVFDDTNTCYGYITSIQSKQIFLIVSGSLGRTIVPLIHPFEQVEYIYIFCANKQLHEQWAKEYHKIRGVFDNSSFLLSKLCLSVTCRFNNSNSISIYNIAASKERSMRNLVKQSTIFMWFQVLLEILLRMPGTDKSESEMLDFCRLMYENNDEELRKVDEFNDYYAPDQAIFWYTRDCFLYRLMNRFMRSENIDMIYKFRHFIKDLHDALRRQYIEDMNSSEEYIRSSTVYRGQRMSAVELEELKKNVHNLIAMNTFLSTTLHKHVALIYAGDTHECPYVEAVLFEIDINTIDRTNTKPFAKITKHSNFVMEDEVLFSMGAIFQIDSVEQLPDGMWIVKLHLTSIEDKQLTSLSEYITKNIKEETTLLDFGDILLAMGEDDKADIYFKKDDYETALDNYTAALDEQEQSQPPNYLCLPQAYENIGKTHEKLGHSHIALQYYRQQLQLYLNSNEPKKDLIAKIEQKINFLCHESDDFNDTELEHSKQKLEIYLKIRPTNHPDFIKIYSNIGLALSQLKNYQNALINYEKALEVALLSLPPNHDLIKIAYYNVGFCQCKTGDYKSALKNYDTAIGLELASQSPKLLLIAKICNSRGHVYLLQKDYRNAAQNYEQAIQISQNNSTHHPKYLQNLGNVCLKIGEYEKAVKALEKALRIEEDSSTPETLMMIELYIGIGHCYFALKQYIHAIHNYQRAVDAYDYLLTLKNDCSQIGETNNAKTFEQISISALNTEDHAESIAQEYQKMIEIHFQYPSEIGKVNELISAMDQFYDDYTITENYEHFIKACIENKQFGSALKIYQKLIDLELKQSSKDSETMGTIYANAAHICYLLKTYDLANKYLEKSLELLPISVPVNENTTLVSHINLGSIMCNEQKHEEALCLFSKLLSIELTRQPLLYINLALMHFNIGLIYCAMKQYKTAILSFEEAMDRSELCPVEQVDNLPIFFEDLHCTCFHDEDFNRAIEYCTKLLIVKLERKLNNLIALFPVYYELGSRHFKKCYYRSAIRNWEKVVEILLAASPKNNNSLTSIYSELARAYKEENKISQSLSYCERAIENEKRKKSPNTFALGWLYNYMGYIYHTQRNYEQSIIDHKHAIEITAGGEHENAIYFENIASSYALMNLNDESKKNYDQALQIRLKSATGDLLPVAKSYADYANFYFQKENYQMSIDLYEKAIQICASITTVPDCLIMWYGKLAEACYMSNDLEKATTTCKLALEKQQLVINSGPMTLIDVYYRMSMCYYLKGDNSKALSMYQKILELRLAHSQAYDHKVAVAFRNVGRGLYRLESYNESILYYEKAIEIYSKSNSVDKLSSTILYKNFGDSLKMCHRFSEALDHYKKAIAFLLLDFPLKSNFHWFKLDYLPKPNAHYLLKELTVIQNLENMKLE